MSKHNDSRLRVSLGGDFFLRAVDGFFLPKLSSGSLELAPIIDTFNAADLSIVNFEGVIPKDTCDSRKNWALRMRSDAASLLKTVGVKCVSLANNHIGDFGVSSLANTIEILDANDIIHAGAGIRPDDAASWRTISFQSGRIAFASFCSREIPDCTFASEFGYGINEFDLQCVVEQVAAKAKEGFIVVVSLHWGEEFFDYPTPKQREMARIIVDAGAAVIVGHHPHVAQGFERHGNGVIFYSLGNLVMSSFDLQTGERFSYPEASKIAPIFTVDLTDGVVSSIQVSLFRVEFLSRSVFASKIEEGLTNDVINRLNSPLRIENYQKFWDSYKPSAEQRAHDVWTKFVSQNMLRRIRARLTNRSMRKRFYGN
jgi:poly-gamma-glutamate synthesis protein (capsule biosynthesis protein)